VFVTLAYRGLFGISPNELNSAPFARSSRPSCCQVATHDSEATYVGVVQAKRHAVVPVQWQCTESSTRSFTQFPHGGVHYSQYQTENWKVLRLRSIVMSTPVGVSMSVCLSASISPEPHARFLPNFVHVAYGRGSVLLRRRCFDMKLNEMQSVHAYARRAVTSGVTISQEWHGVYTILPVTHTFIHEWNEPSCTSGLWMTSCFFSTMGRIAVWISLRRTDFA